VLREEGVRIPGVKVTPRLRSGQAAKRRARKGGTPSTFVTADWTVADIVARYPQATAVMAEYGLHCFGCSANAMESLEEGCMGHGFSTEDIQNLVDDINETIATTPPRPETLTITKDAALAIKEVAVQEKVEGEGLSVQANADGSFYMEFRKEPEQGEKIFRSADVSDVSVFASILTLQRIGGATIDFREGKFKLDLQEIAGCCKGEKENCGCK
jgi:hybrid cluster-associated redox disulfide protein